MYSNVYVTFVKKIKKAEHLFQAPRNITFFAMLQDARKYVELRSSMWTQQLWMFNMEYEHHEQPPLYFGDDLGAGAGSEDIDTSSS